MNRLLLVLLLLSLAGCSLLSDERNEPAPVESPELFSGTSFGECLGYCVTELAVAGRTATLVYFGWSFGETVPDVRHTRTLSAAERAELDRALDRQALRRAEAQYGCPDCADGGAEWVGAQLGEDEEKRVTFEAGKEVDGLDAYIEAMRALRASFPAPPQR